jgi:hypothetical protein
MVSPQTYTASISQQRRNVMGNRRIESFLLRIVVDDGLAQDAGELRGRIQHIASGAELQIAELEQLVSFINSHIASITSPGTPSPAANNSLNADG